MQVAAASSTTTVAPPATPTTETPARPGKSAESVGHAAKAAVAAAREAGLDVPRNAQGLAASQIARGADPASIFAARTAETPSGEEPLPVAPDPDTTGPGDENVLTAPQEPLPVATGPEDADPATTGDAAPNQTLAVATYTASVTSVSVFGDVGLLDLFA